MKPTPQVRSLQTGKSFTPNPFIGKPLLQTMKWVPQDLASYLFIKELNFMAQKKGLAPDRFRAGKIIFNPETQGMHNVKERTVIVVIEEIVKRKPSGFTVSEVERESACVGAKLKQVKLEKGAYTTYALIRDPYTNDALLRENDFHVIKERQVNSEFIR
ncbi:Uncharacterised protein [uncultured archaeon]|nr:Uncharacterised protein [uncultured archaeon]